MKRPPCLSTRLVPGAFLLAGFLVLAQTASAANNRQPRGAASGQSAGRQAQPGSTPGMAVNEQGSRGHNGIPAQSIAVDHAGGNGVRRADTDKSGDNPLYEGKGQANLKPSGTNTQGGTAGQSALGSGRKSGSIIALDRNSSNATESLAPSNKAKTGGNPLYEEGGKSGTNPLYESGKLQKAGASSHPSPSPETQSRKRPGRVKYGSIFLGRGHGAPGMAVNEQGSSKAPARRRR